MAVGLQEGGSKVGREAADLVVAVMGSVVTTAAHLEPAAALKVAKGGKEEPVGWAEG